MMGMYEEKTGRSPERILVPNLLPNHSWMTRLLAKDLGMDLFEADHRAVFETTGITGPDFIEWDTSDTGMLPLFALMANL